MSRALVHLRESRVTFFIGWPQHRQHDLHIRATYVLPPHDAPPYACPSRAERAYLDTNSKLTATDFKTHNHS